MVAVKGNLFAGTMRRVKDVTPLRDRMARRVAHLAALPRPPRPTTDAQRALLDAIGALTAKLGRGPSTVELAAFTGLTRSGVRSTMRRLERDGLVADIPKQVRSGRWGITDKGRRL